MLPPTVTRLVAYRHCQYKLPLVVDFGYAVLRALDDNTLSCDARLREELATYDAVSGLVKGLAILPGGFEEREHTFMSAGG